MSGVRGSISLAKPKNLTPRTAVDLMPAVSLLTSRTGPGHATSRPFLGGQSCFRLTEPAIEYVFSGAAPSMTVSYENSKTIFEGIRAAGIRSVSALPETWLGLLL